jgi:molybdenum cofactor sulfurtransferase
MSMPSSSKQQAEEDLFSAVKSFRHDELPELASIVFLDYMGCGLAPRTMRTGSSEELLGNPHSHHALGQRAAAHLVTARRRTIEFFGASKDYDLVFTSGCTASLGMIARLFPFGESGSVFMHPFAHNSLLGIRESVTAERYHVVETADQVLRLLDEKGTTTSDSGERGLHLICVPAECNFSGAQIDFKPFVAAAQTSDKKKAAFVVVDGAAMAGKVPVSLDGTGVDFFTFSFYKMFGWPTGLGGLLVRKGAPQDVLVSHKKYFGGGTVASNMHDVVGGHILRPSFNAALEDGTPNFYGIAAVPKGFDCIERLGGVEMIERRLQYLRAHCVEQLEGLRHTNGQSVVRVYNTTTVASVCGWGCSVSFTILGTDGTLVGHTKVEAQLCSKDVYVRSGCFCNPGACQHFLGFGGSLMQEARALGHTCGDGFDVVHGNVPTGCVRASLGSSTIVADVDKLVSVIKETFSC